MNKNNIERQGLARSEERTKLTSSAWFYSFLSRIPNILQQAVNSLGRFAVCFRESWRFYFKIILWCGGIISPSFVSANGEWPDQGLSIGEEQGVGSGEILFEKFFFLRDSITVYVEKPMIDHIHQVGDQSFLIRSPAREIIENERSPESNNCSCKHNDCISTHDDSFSLVGGVVGIFLGLFIVGPITASIFSRIFRGSWNFL